MAAEKEESAGAAAEETAPAQEVKPHWLSESQLEEIAIEHNIPVDWVRHAEKKRHEEPERLMAHQWDLNNPYKNYFCWPCSNLMCCGPDESEYPDEEDDVC